MSKEPPRTFTSHSTLESDTFNRDTDGGLLISCEAFLECWLGLNKMWKKDRRTITANKHGTFFVRVSVSVRLHNATGDYVIQCMRGMSHEENRQLASVIISRKEPKEIDQCYASLKKANLAQQTNFSEQWGYFYMQDFISIYTVCTNAIIITPVISVSWEVSELLQEKVQQECV